MPLPEIVLPAWAGKIGRILPAKPPQAALVATLNIMLKKGLLPADMTLFAGRKFEIDVLDAGIKVRFGANGEKFTADGFDDTPDLRLAANGIDFMRMMLREEDPDTLFSTANCKSKATPNSASSPKTCSTAWIGRSANGFCSAAHRRHKSEPAMQRERPSESAASAKPKRSFGAAKNKEAV